VREHLGIVVAEFAGPTGSYEAAWLTAIPREPLIGRAAWHPGLVAVPFDYEVDPERYRSGMRIAGAYAAASLYEWVARILASLGAGLVLDVGCADGPLHAALPPGGPRLSAWMSRRGQSIRCAITGPGIRGHCANSARTCGS
jgi:hypothetical protein